MSKYITRANELLEQAQALSEVTVKFGQAAELNRTYIDLLLDIQTLFFCESPQFPLYIQSMKLNERCDIVSRRPGDYFNESDFQKLKKYLTKYLEYREFLEAED